MLRELSKVNIESARNLLMDVLCDYQGFNGCTLILVFDAYRVEGGQERVFNYHNIHVVFTKEAETADQYIEKTVHKIGKKADVTVATSDALIRCGRCITATGATTGFAHDTTPPEQCCGTI